MAFTLLFIVQKCGLNENVHHRLVNLNTYFLGGGAVWEVIDPLGGAVLMEEVCHWGQAKRVYSLVLRRLLSLLSAHY